MQTSIKPLDTTIEIVTPENIAFQYRVAGPFLRLPAYLIDKAICWGSLIVFGIALILTLGMAGLAGLGIGVILIAEFLLSWFYGGLTRRCNTARRQKPTVKDYQSSQSP